MKTLKFDHSDAEEIKEGKKNTTWRLYDDKDLSVDDKIKIIDKTNSDDSSQWKVIGEGKVVEIIEKKLDSVDDNDMAGHKHFANLDEALETYRNYYGSRVTLDTPVKIIHFEFAPSQGEMATAAMLLEEAKMYTDGGSRNNPGHSACAYVICKMDDTVVEKSGYYMGIATNNQAEYYGMIKGLERARELGIDKVNLNSDSQLVVNQMNGFYKVKNQELAPLHQQLKVLGDSFEKVTFHYIPRALNAEADKEVNRILDDQEDARYSKSTGTFKN
jgi:ribonuclease HI